MDQELKQRLIGAAVITALAAIFVPMLFDDPVDESGKIVNELKMPELPGKAQDVEIMPLPEKVEDVVQTPPAPEASVTEPKPPVSDNESEEDAEEGFAPRPQITANDTKPAPPQKPSGEPAPRWVEPSEDDDVAPRPQPEAVKPAKLPPATENAKPAKPAIAEPIAKPAPVQVENAAVRWYLNAGTFGQKTNALALQDKLKQQGFAATLKEVAGEKGTVYKVRIGPMLDKAKAQEVKAKLSRINVNSFVSGEE
ncbi:SPOR domain-containing protein [Methylomonas rhizoryzae]|uniref:SPOR domain-containing protein n=1 Tax=Methylomonas rhizoryzae TaxID=2608981 RepID=UPI001231C122|nr:SPOR domain-containing protein [Methylomonas rhizoryzae]